MIFVLNMDFTNFKEYTYNYVHASGKMYTINLTMTKYIPVNN